MATVPANPDKRKGPFRALHTPSREMQYHVDSVGWTPDKIRCAVESAEAGSLMDLADLVETMITDDRISGVLETRTHGLLGLPLKFTGGSSAARESLETTAWDTLHPESEISSLLSWGIMLGVGLAQRIPLPRLPGEPQRYTLETWSPRFLWFDWNKNVWRVQTNKGQEIVNGDRWILYTPYGKQRPWAWGKWRACAFPWLLKRFALEDRANYSETSGQPVRVGLSPEGSTEPQRVSFRNQIAVLGRNGVLELPEGWDFKIVESTGTNWQIYTESVSWADSAISIVLAGQVVTTEGTTGFSEGNVQDRILSSLLRFDSKNLGHALHDQSLKPWALVNFGSYDAAPFPLWKTEKPADLASEANTLEVLSRALVGLDKALISSGVKVDVFEFANTYNIPLKDIPPDETDTVTGDLGLAPRDIAKIVTINEARAANGLGPLRLPDGTPDPEGTKRVARDLSAPDEGDPLENPPKGLE